MDELIREYISKDTALIICFAENLVFLAFLAYLYVKVRSTSKSSVKDTYQDDC